MEKIQWPRAAYWDKPWNPVVGCKPASPACENCYARAMARRFRMKGSETFEPLFYEKPPPRSGVVFCGNMTDLFGEWIEPQWAEDYIGQTLGRSDRATYLWLTKRVESMCRVLQNGRLLLRGDDGEDEDYWCRFADIEFGNQYFGFTAEDQKWFDTRMTTWRRNLPRWANGWLSAEPLLGPIDMMLNVFASDRDKIKWIVVGCESGPNRRPCKVEWVESVVNQAKEHGIPVFVKQLDVNGSCIKDINKFPEHLRIRQVPWGWKGVGRGKGR